MNPTRYRSKPRVVEAAQVTLDNAEEVADWIGGRPTYLGGNYHGVIVHADHHPVYASIGAWLVRDGGRVQSLDHDRFLASYEPDGS